MSQKGPLNFSIGLLVWLTSLGQMLQFPLLKLLCVLHTWVIFLALILCVCSRVVNMVAHGSLSTITRTQSHKSQQSFFIATNPFDGLLPPKWWTLCGCSRPSPESTGGDAVLDNRKLTPILLLGDLPLITLIVSTFWRSLLLLIIL